jgi:cytochrome P450
MGAEPDHLGPEMEPFGWYRTMRERTPVLHTDRGAWSARGVWMVFRHADVQRVLSDHEAFSSEYGNLGLINTDPPRHRQLRNLVTLAFTPRAVEELRARIQEIVRDLLDGVAGAGGMDLIEEFAVPLPVTVIAELLGIPVTDRERFKLWSDAIVTGGGERMGHSQAMIEMGSYFSDLLEERRRHPRADLVGDLLAARIDGESLSQQDLLSFCVLLLIAGNETTTNLIGNAIICLDTHPQSLEQLRAEPDLLPTAIEEVLRFRSPVQSMFRVTKAEVELNGQRIPPGSQVVAWIGSANRDPLQFPDPDRFDIRRTPNRHLAFGHGIHFCLGAPLARLEGLIALDALLRRLPGLAVDRSHRLHRLESEVVYGVRRLPVTFEPRPAVSA